MEITPSKGTWHKQNNKIHLKKYNGEHWKTIRNNGQFNRPNGHWANLPNKISFGDQTHKHITSIPK